jgi:hypothetical protein
MQKQREAAVKAQLEAATKLLEARALMAPPPERVVDNHVKVSNAEERARILALPKIDYYDTNLYPDRYHELRRPDVPAVTRLPSTGHLVRGLNAAQNAALWAIQEQEGGVITLPVGTGKQLIAFLAGTVLQADYLFFVTPASSRAQVAVGYSDWRTIFRLPYHLLIISPETISRDSGVAGIEANLAAAKRPVIVIDEAHKFGNQFAARTGRLARLLSRHSNLRVVAMSGSFMSHSITQFAHLSQWSLGLKSPLPRTGTSLLDAWSRVLDHSKIPPKLEDYTHVEPLVLWAGGESFSGMSSRDRRTQARRAFAKRLDTSPGVVTARGEGLGTSLRLERAPGSRDLNIPDEVKDKLARLRANGEIEFDGVVDVLADPLAQMRAERQLAMGFYYKWEWPLDSNQRPKIDFDWVETRRAWNAFVRSEILECARDGYDSEMTIRTTIVHECATLPQARWHAGHVAWQAWAPHSSKRWSGQPTPPTRTVWIDTFFMDYVNGLIRQMPASTLVWYRSDAVREALRAAGHEVAEGRSFDTKKSRRLCVSINSHAEALNLQQAWHTNLVVEPPAGANIWEQMLGRTHRQHQRADEVVAYVVLHHESFERKMVEAFLASTGVQEAMGTPMKLCFADKVDMPAYHYDPDLDLDLGDSDEALEFEALWL